MTSTISHNTLYLAALTGALTLSCTSEAHRIEHAAEPTRVHINGSEFAAGTVGAAANGYWLDMTGVTRWYEVMADVSRYAEAHPEYHVKVDMQLDSPLEPYLERIQADSVFAATLARHRLSVRDFAILTVVTGVARMSERLVDSLGQPGQPVNVGDRLVAFWRAHRTAIDSLDGTLRN